jgi:hypothetical protein
VYKAIHGKDAMPSGPKWETLKLLTRLMDSMFCAIFMPPSAPQAAVEEMRVAFGKLEKDPEFIARYTKVVSVKPRFVIGSEGEKVISELANIDPATVDFLTQYIESGK